MPLYIHKIDGRFMSIVNEVMRETGIVFRKAVNGYSFEENGVYVLHITRLTLMENLKCSARNNADTLYYVAQKLNKAGETDKADMFLKIAAQLKMGIKHNDNFDFTN